MHGIFYESTVSNIGRTVKQLVSKGRKIREGKRFCLENGYGAEKLSLTSFELAFSIFSSYFFDGYTNAPNDLLFLLLVSKRETFSISVSKNISLQISQHIKKRFTLFFTFSTHSSPTNNRHAPPQYYFVPSFH